MIIKRIAALTILLIAFIFASAEEIEPQIIKLNCGSGVRYAKLYQPQQTDGNSVPLVFVFHGRGGSMHGAAKNIAIHNYWPEAMVVYPHGMWCEGGYKDGLGWVIDEQSRDLEMFDVLLRHLLNSYKIDRNRIYATGHSNGGAFVHALWRWRGDIFAAVAPSASTSSKLGESRYSRAPKPVLIIGGEADEVVKIASIRREIAIIKQINNPRNTEIFIHKEGHKFLPQSAVEIVRFFKKHTK